MFSRLNLRPDDEGLPYRMPEVCNETGHGLTNIVIAWDKLKPVLHPELFFDIPIIFLHIPTMC